MIYHKSGSDKSEPKVLVVLIIASMMLFASIEGIGAHSGCCSWHDGVCSYQCSHGGTGYCCCDGTPISTTCAPYYAVCSDYTNPQVTTNAATSVTTASATLNGYIDSTGAPVKEHSGSISCQVWFEYGKTTSYGYSTTKQSKSSAGSFSGSTSGMDDDTTYHFRAVTSSGVGTDYGSDMTFITSTEADTTPPASVTNLQNITYAQTYITWTWTDPTVTDFSHVMVYLDGVFKENMTKGTQTYTATALTADTEYTIGTKTVDTTGNINPSMVTGSARTAPVATITVSPSTATVDVGDTQTFTATAYDQDGDTMSDVTISWTSSDTSVGTVSPATATTGTAGTATTTFTAVTEGTASVMASSGTVSDTASVTVTATSAITATRAISPDTIVIGEEFTVTVVVTANQTVYAPSLDEDLPGGWTVTEVSSGGATFKSDTTEWLWVESLAAGTSKTVIYDVTVPSDAATGSYSITGGVSASGVAATAVGGESTVTVTTDWNPWDDDCIITTEEIQDAVSCWLTDTPKNGHLITTAELQEMIEMWLTT